MMKAINIALPDLFVIVVLTSGLPPEYEAVMEGEAQCTGTMRKGGKAVDNLSMLTSYCYIRCTCIRLQEISKVSRKPR